VHFGAPIETAGLTLDDRGMLAERVRAEVARLLAEAAAADGHAVAAPALASE
jgi:hypothetical protein